MKEISKKNADVKTKIMKFGTEVVKHLNKISAKSKKGFWARLFRK